MSENACLSFPNSSFFNLFYLLKRAAQRLLSGLFHAVVSSLEVAMWYRDEEVARGVKLDLATHLMSLSS